MNSPPRKRPTRSWALGFSTCNGARPDRLRPENSNPSSCAASARFDCDGLVLPRMRGADAVAAAIIASGALDRDSIWGHLTGWRLYRRKWYAARGGTFHQVPVHDMQAWLFQLLLKCVLVSRGGRLRPFVTNQRNVRAVRCALGRALTVCDDPTRKLAAVGGERD